MSIIVSGFDMPKSCLKCEFFYEDRDHHDNFSSFCRLLKDGVYNEHMTIDGFGGNERYLGCPVAPKDSVIDRVLETLDKEIDLYRQLGKPDNQHMDVIIALTNFRKLIVRLKEGEQE